MQAAEYAILRIKKYFPGFSGAIISVSGDEEVGVACSRIEGFQIGVRRDGDLAAQLKNVTCVENKVDWEFNGSERGGWELGRR